MCCIGDGGNDVSMIQAADVGSFSFPFPFTIPKTNFCRLNSKVSVSSAKKGNKPL